ncbi:MAG TPA: hypothetical protein VK004_05495 [Ignavibacteria bacterium]|nr:hypothetical protein [Ignavibacteria bacterium]
MGKSLQILFVFALIAFLSACGDNKQDQTGKDSTGTMQTEENDPKSVEGNNTSGETQGEEKGPNDLGMKDGLPGDYPADVPQPPDSKVIGFLSSSEGTNVSFESPKGVQELAEFYKAEMSKGGYTVKPEGEAISETNALIDWTKSGKDVSLVVVRDPAKDVSSIVVTYK